MPDNHNYYWMHSDWIKFRIEMLYYDKIDVVAGKLTNTNTKMFETTKLSGDLTSTGFTRLVDNKYKFDYDAEHKKLLVSYRLYLKKKRQDQLRPDWPAGILMNLDKPRAAIHHALTAR